MPLEKLVWSEKRKRDFRDYMHYQIANTDGDRAPLIMKWRSLIEQHRARVIGDGISSEPFEGASDLEYPLTSIHYEPVYSDVMQTLHLPKDFWGVVGIRDDAVDSAKPLQEFLSIVEKNYIKMREVNAKAAIDNIILGTAVYKYDINHLSKRVRDYNDQGRVEKRIKVQFNPRVRHVPLQRFWIPASSCVIDPDEEDGAPWVAHEFYLTSSQLRARAEGAAPFMPNFDKEAVKDVLKYEIDNQYDDVKAEIERQDEYPPFENKKIRLFEIWARFDIDGDGSAEDIVVIWHQEARVILRAVLNPFMHGRRPFEAVPYVPSFGFYGIGLGESDEWAQIAMTRLLNNAIDNTLIANTKMWGVPLGSDISPNEGIWANKVWYLGPEESIQEISMGEVHPSMFHMMDRIAQLSESRTGVSELRQGNLTDLPGRTPASTVLSVLQEGKKKFDMILNNYRASLGRIGVGSLQNLIQISKDDPRFKQLAVQTLGLKDAAKVVQILDGPVHSVEEMFGVSISASSSQVNKEVEKQSYTALAQIMAQFYPTMLQYAQGIAQLAGDPEILISTIKAAYSGEKELLKRVLEAYDVQNPDEYLPEGQATPGAPGAPQAAPAGAPAPAPGGAAGGTALSATGAPQAPAPQAELLTALLGLG